MARDAHETAARVRAALAYANIKLTIHRKKQPVGKVSGDNVQRITSPTNPRKASDEELQEIARVSGVPLAFLEIGFAPFEPISDQEKRIYELEQRIAVLESAIPGDRRKALSPDTEKAVT